MLILHRKVGIAMKRGFAWLFLFSIGLILCFAHWAAAQWLPDTRGDLWYYQETFSDKRLKNNQILDKNGKVVWRINTAEWQTNAITDTGALELGGARYMQRAVLAEDIWGYKQDYAMEFTLNLQKLGNEGHSGRPIAIIIPRAKDAQFNQFYAVTYYMENTISNLFKFKWGIVNTAAPTKMKPLVEGYYLLREDVDYTGRVVIRNTPEGDVHIRFYIDGPINPAKQYKPLLEYIDSSPYKITAGVTGPAFGMVGWTDAAWGLAPVVRYDNIRLFELRQFEKYEVELKINVENNPKDIEGDAEYDTVKYVINKGIMAEYSPNAFKPHENISVGDFLKALVILKEGKYPAGTTVTVADLIKRGIGLGLIREGEFSDYRQPITRYDAALLLARFYGNPAGDKTYLTFIRDWAVIPQEYLQAVLYAYYEGYLRLDDNLEFNGNLPISRAEAAAVFLRMLDAGYRKINYDLELPNILSNGAVLQRNKKVPIWGRGVTGDTITVRFKNQVKTTVVKNGHWYVELDPMPHGGPYTLKVNSSKKKITLYNIWVGEVFVIAGQSNSEMFLADCYGAKETRRKFYNSTRLRYYMGEVVTSVWHQFNSQGNWHRAEGWVLDMSPAIGTFFVEKILELNKELSRVTIGIIKLSYGGTTIEAFTPYFIFQEQNYVQKDNEAIVSGFWNGYMEPVTPFAVKGVIYYQGEQSAHLGYKYEPKLRDYLRGIRTKFKDPNLPVILVQLAGYGYNDFRTDLNEWPIIRGVQQRVANTTPNTGLVTAVDLADPDPIEIHPREKKKVGERLAYRAMELFYGKPCEKRSAELRFCKLEGNKVITGFDYDFGRIYIKNNNIENSFQILDRQGIWQDAKAVVNSDNRTVTIWNDDIAEPLGVRYAWVNYPNVCLYNAVDLPVLPFRVLLGERNTGEAMLKISNHDLKSYDAIVNTTRSHQFRLVNVIDPDTLVHQYPINGQSAGDIIEKLSKLESVRAQEGTTETVIKLTQHGLSVGDWIRNDSKGWEVRRVIRVIDENTFVVDAVKGQSAGDEIAKFRLVGKVVAE